MPKKYYCSLCGQEVVYTCKAVKGKGLIMHLITPHECEGFSIESNPDGKPTAEEVINAAKPISGIQDADTKKQVTGSGTIFDRSNGDKRDGIKSTAPASLLGNMNNLTDSGVETVEG